MEVITRNNKRYKVLPSGRQYLICSFASCNSNAQKAGLCVRHGAPVPRCTTANCNKMAQPHTTHCYKHGDTQEKALIANRINTYWHNNRDAYTAHKLRSKLHDCLIRRENANRTIELCSASLIEVKQHLESKFTQGMTWDNYGTYWQIDHIKPCSQFNLDIPEQVKECFHYTNLQPLTIQDNQSKANKI